MNAAETKRVVLTTRPPTKWAVRVDAIEKAFRQVKGDESANLKGHAKWGGKETLKRGCGRSTLDEGGALLQDKGCSPREGHSPRKA